MGQLDKLSKDFADSLRKQADAMRERKLAQERPDMPATQSLKEKEDRVSEVMRLVGAFHDRIVKEWLFSLDDQSVEEVGKLFGEVAQVGAIQFGMLMKASGACNPWKLVGDMFAPAADEGAVIVIEDKPRGAGEAPPTQPM